MTVTTLGVPLLRKSPEFAATYPDARLIVEMAWGADLSADPDTWVWTDITTDVQQAGSQLTISPMGRGDNTSRTQPAACSLVANNPDGRYSRGPQSPNYPNVHQNVPLRVWVTLTGDEADRRLRFQGLTWSLRPGWNQKGNVATVTVQAAGRMRQLTQGATPVRTPLRRFIADAAPIAAWMIDEPAGADVAASVLLGAPPLVPTGGVTLGAASTLPGTSAVATEPTPSGTVGPALSGNVPDHVFTGFYAFDYWTNIYAADDDTLGTLLFSMQAQFEGGDFHLFATVAGDQANGVVRWATFYGTDEWNIGTLTMAGDYAFGAGWTHVFVTLQQVGPDVVITTAHNGVAGGTATLSGVTMGILRRMDLVNATDTVFNGAHGAVQFGPLAIYTDPAAVSSYVPGAGYPGETVTDRLTRLCAEAGVPIDIIGTSTITMGPQSIDTLVNLLRECEAADLGVLGDGLGPGLYYVCRSSRYNQAVSMALTATDLAAPPQPEDDDQKLRNKYTVGRKGGAQGVTYQDEDGPQGTLRVGTYDTDGGQLNLDSDTPLLDVAAWLVHLGTIDGYRYPQLSLNARISAAHADEWAAMTPGTRLTVDGIAGVSPQHPPGTVDLLAEGWSEVLSPHIWTAVVNCESADPWRIFTIEDAQLGRLGFDGQALLADVDEDDTAWTVTSPVRPEMTTSAEFPGDFPYHVEVDGEIVQITDTADLVGDTFDRTASGGWGTADSGQAWTYEGGSSSQASVSAGAGHHAVATIGTTCRSLMAGPADLEATWRVSIPSVATGVAAQSGFIVREDGANTNLLIFRILFNTDGTIIPRISKRVASTETTLATAGSVMSYAGGDWIRARVVARGTRLAFRVWADGAPEPGIWHLDIADATFLAAGRIGFRSDTPASWGGGNPFTFSYDDFRVVNPQTVTVVRSVNGVATPHAAGALLALHRPGVLAL